MIDGMATRKHNDWDAMVGLIDLGAGSVDSDMQHKAIEALEIITAGLTSHWKVTLG